MFYDTVHAFALTNPFHPIKNYLRSLVWDKRARLDTMLIDYAGAEDTKFNRAVSSIPLIAACRRIEQPGAKFDELPIWQSDMQGSDKSTSVYILARNKEWFSDDIPIGKDSKKVIEQSEGVWIFEAAEILGLKETRNAKAMLSRWQDKARLAYGRIPEEVQRQFIIIGTTNDMELCFDPTGNRRLWPVIIKRFDLEKLKADVDQIWAEAFAREQAGESIRLDQSLWPEAAEAQARHEVYNPYADVLREKLIGIDAGRIKSATLMQLFDIGVIEETRNPRHRVLIKKAMLDMGWEYSKQVWFSGPEGKGQGKNLHGYKKGEGKTYPFKSPPQSNWEVVCVWEHGGGDSPPFIKGFFRPRGRG